MIESRQQGFLIYETICCTKDGRIGYFAKSSIPVLITRYDK
jgi:hypothetical protein